MNWLSLFEKILFGEEIEEVPSPPQNTCTIDHAVWRLFNAKKNSPSAVVDHAILVRQCLVWIYPDRIRGRNLSREDKNRLEEIGVHLSLSGYLEVEPYCPEWLGDGESRHNLDALPQLMSIDESLPAEEWLQNTTGKSTWRSQAQKEACWAALTSQPGETNLIGLPTGAGKSLIFQIAAAFSTGLTVVVVPTVALGLDQLAIAGTLPTVSSLNPMNYSSDDGAEVVRDAVANRQCRLLFTSPEACVSGRLRSVLDQHASEGWMRWVVIDEAHIVESWGADFRIEFQLLGALVRRWRQHSDHRIRTLLLSATFTQSTQETLRGLFVAHEEPWKASVAQRLRPEIHYHIQRAADAEEQKKWIKEALLKLPRPLILYTTEKAGAKHWFEIAKGLGLERVECFHGDITRRGERNRIMDDWRSDQIDLMVATSAFGMGVDKPDVRAVVHACFPESIDRFYQEVGRGGRDGATTQSVMIYTEKDKRVGKGLAPKLLLPETVSERWAALWNSRKLLDSDEDVFHVSCGARGEKFIGSRTYQEHVRWNKRLLQMLHRAKLINITGLYSEKAEEDGDEYREWVVIRDIQFPSVDSRVGERLSKVREEELMNIAHGFKSLEHCAQGNPICLELRKYYGGDVMRACGSCQACRLGKELRRSCGTLQWPDDALLTTPKVSVVPMSRIKNGNGQASWILSIRKTLVQEVANRFIVSESDFDLATALLRQAMGSAKPPRIYRLDRCKGKKFPLINSRDKVVVLHLSNFQSNLGEANSYGEKCSHWMPMDQIDDQFGRSRFTQDHNARLFDSFETWLFDSQSRSFC